MRINTTPNENWQLIKIRPEKNSIYIHVPDSFRQQCLNQNVTHLIIKTKDNTLTVQPFDTQRLSTEDENI